MWFKSTRRLLVTSELRGGNKGLFYNRLGKQRHLKPPITASCSTLTTGCEEMCVFFATMVRHSLISARPPSWAQRGFNGRIPHFPQWLKGLHLHVMKKVVTVFKYSRFFSRLYFTKLLFPDDFLRFLLMHVHKYMRLLLLTLKKTRLLLLGVLWLLPTVQKHAREDNLE